MELHVAEVGKMRGLQRDRGIGVCLKNWIFLDIWNSERGDLQVICNPDQFRPANRDLRYTSPRVSICHQAQGQDIFFGLAMKRRVTSINFRHVEDTNNRCHFLHRRIWPFFVDSRKHQSCDLQERLTFDRRRPRLLEMPIVHRGLQCCVRK